MEERVSVIKSQDCVVKNLAFTIQTRLLTTLSKKAFENFVRIIVNAGNQSFLPFPQYFCHSC